MWYFKGIKTNEKELFVSVDSALNVECSNGIVKYFNEQKWLKAKGDISIYLQSVLNFQEEPVACFELDFALSANSHKPLKKVVIRTDSDAYYQALDKAINENFFKKVFNSEVSLPIIKKRLAKHEEYVICDYCSSSDETGALIKVDRYEKHVLTAHKINAIPANVISDKINDAKERLKVLKTLIMRFQNDIHNTKLQYEISLKRQR